MQDSRETTASENKTEVHKSYINVELALRTVPNFDCSNSEQANIFRRSCDFAVRIIDPKQVDMLVQGFLIKLSGRALRFTRYKDITTYKEFIKIIAEIADTKKLLTQLQMKLLTCKISAGERVQEYHNKMKQLLHDLVNTTMEEESYANEEDIDKSLHNQVLNAFISGLPDSYKVLLEARGPKKLDEALAYALEEEAEKNLSKETWMLFSSQESTKDQQPQSAQPKSGTSRQNYSGGYNNTSSNRTNTGCLKCGSPNHFAWECRASTWHQKKFKASQQSGSQNSKPIAKSVLICRYCKKEGHMLEVCRKRQYRNSKIQQSERKALADNQSADNGEESLKRIHCVYGTRISR